MLHWIIQNSSLFFCCKMPKHTFLIEWQMCLYSDCSISNWTRTYLWEGTVKHRSSVGRCGRGSALVWPNHSLTSKVFLFICDSLSNLFQKRSCHCDGNNTGEWDFTYHPAAHLTETPLQLNQPICIILIAIIRFHQTSDSITTSSLYKHNLTVGLNMKWLSHKRLQK